ncbi:NAD(P)H-hydrate epimerase [Anatilimnocola sp. NA78]|uniref:NAD(P)H-hydrate epimerase n=1 Tax=Anatilimnocola sp. NA78 TaxID=3415683 RepID=UPI003CE4E8E3
MTNSLTRTQVREIDARAMAEYGISGLVLMENAARGCTNALLTVGCRGPVVVCCGKGNNGGDGFAIARQLNEAGIVVRVLLLARAAELKGDALANYQIALNCQLPIEEIGSNVTADEIDACFEGAEWIVDALLGTGTTGDPKGPYATAIKRMNAATAKRLAVDLPSGLDCDTGKLGQPTVDADLTCTFVAAKQGFAQPAAQAHLGEVRVIPIGVPRKLLADYGL